METRFVIFHKEGTIGNVARMSPSAIYIEEDYAPVVVRIYAETAPVRDAKIDILGDNNISIFNDRTPYQQNLTTGVVLTEAADTTAVLPANTNSEENEGDFADVVIVQGTWLHCNLAGTANIFFN
jgi:hypothetical protein